MRKKKILIIAAVILAILTAVFVAAAIYVGDYYPADTEAIEVFSPQGTAWREEADGTVVFEVAGATKGLIFYPGGKVEHTAYIPLMQACAEQGVHCVLVEMPCRLAVLDMNAADGIREKYPEIKDWYIGGHSLGGSMAASYLADRATEYKGLVLLGSYSTADLSGTDLDVLSVFGSEDKVMNREKYDKCRGNLPQGFEEVVIDGGCHAYFGMYGAQEGDGTPTITAEAQIAMTAAHMIRVMNGS